MRYWLIKSEPSTYGIDHMARDKKTAWSGVRNYQARNFMRDQMKVGDRAFFYHSSCDEPGIAGIVEVSARGTPRRDAVRPQERVLRCGFEARRAALVNVDFKFVKKTPLVSLTELRKHKELAKMRVLQRGNRLSITPVDPDEWDYITKKLMNA